MKYHKMSTLREIELMASEKTKVGHFLSRLKSTCDMFNMSCVAGKKNLSIGFSTRSDKPGRKATENG